MRVERKTQTRMALISARLLAIAAAGYDHVTTYLRAVLGFLGMTDITFIVAEGVSKGEDAAAAAIAKSRADINAILV